MSISKVSKRLPFKSYAYRALLAAFITIIINIIIFYIGKAAGAFPESIIVSADSPLQVSMVIMMSIFGTVVGILIFAAVGSLRVFRIIAIIGFILLIYTPFSVADASTSFIITLEIMHITTAVVTVWVASRK
jgi:hypothetical protein